MVMPRLTMAVIGTAAVASPAAMPTTINCPPSRSSEKPSSTVSGLPSASSTRSAPAPPVASPTALRGSVMAELIVGRMRRSAPAGPVGPQPVRAQGHRQVQP